MSGRANSSAPPENRQGGRDYGRSQPDYNNFNNIMQMMYPPSLFAGRPPNLRRAALDPPWLPLEDRLIGRPLSNGRGPYAGYPMLGLPIPTVDPSPRSLNQWNVQQDSKLTKDEQKKALMKLKKEIYNPITRRISRRVNLYYRDAPVINPREADDEDTKRCAICLEDFEPKQVVTVTPCSHMFHEECIVPWVKSQGQCPVCRFAICERMKQTPPPPLNTTTNAAAAANLPLIISPVREDLDSLVEMLSLMRPLR